MYKLYRPVPYSTRQFFGETFPILQFKCHYYNRKTDTVSKRASVLKEMIANKDKRKNWHFNILSTKAKARNVFEGVHKPSKRQSMLNSLFIKNITDVLSTGDIAPEIIGCGIEITGVKISPCCKILNVFWTVPERNYDKSEDLGSILTIASPRLRAELISRNVMGYVPIICFLRDSTNARVAAFEKALRKLDVESDPNTESCIIPDDDFTKDLYSFKSKKNPEKVNKVEIVEKREEHLATPYKPCDMKSDVFGLDHSKIMEKIIAFKKKGKQLPKTSAVISPDNIEGDLFSKIPGICFQADSDREKILKDFQVKRKMLNKNKNAKTNNVQEYYSYEENDANDSELEQNLCDFIEEQ